MTRLVVVSNRVPAPNGCQQAGGLAVALDGLMKQRGGLWFGWSGGVSASEQTQVTHVGGIDYATIDLTQDEHDRYYNSFSNAVLWPLMHGMQELMRYEREDARSYLAVNRKLAQALSPMLQSGDVIWIHDYHLLPLAATLREQGHSNPIGFFLHTPFPSMDVLAVAPDMPAMLRAMLASDLIGFQTENDADNFAEAAEALAGASRTYGSVLHVAGPQGSRRVRLGVFPVEIDAQHFAADAERASRSAAARALRHSLGAQKLILGAERLDPTKGLLQRFAAFRALLERHPEWRRHATMLQIAATSRKDVGSYKSLRSAMDRDAGGLNADFAEPDWTPLRVVAHSVERESIAGYMRHARVGLVTPLRDGMNLVAKEFVAAQDPANPGVLILSRFAGAAQQLKAAMLVNPYDTEEMADAMHAALTLPLGERQTRWQALWGVLADRSPLAWGESFVDALTRPTGPVADRAPRDRTELKLRPSSAIAVPTHLPVAAPRPKELPLN
jgi:trehalose 6-phosphate synthase